jgi:hypothetical protein
MVSFHQAQAKKDVDMVKKKDLKRIKKIEKKIGTKLKQLPIEIWESENSYSCDEEGKKLMGTGILFLIDEIHEVIQQPEQKTKEQKLVN